MDEGIYHFDQELIFWNQHCHLKCPNCSVNGWCVLLKDPNLSHFQFPISMCVLLKDPNLSHSQFPRLPFIFSNWAAALLGLDQTYI